MKNRALITSGAAGALLAAACCGAPVLAVALGSAGIMAWLAKAAYAVIPALLIAVALIAYGLNSRKASADCRTSTPNEQDIKP